MLGPRVDTTAEQRQGLEEESKQRKGLRTGLWRTSLFEGEQEKGSLWRRVRRRQTEPRGKGKARRWLCRWDWHHQRVGRVKI